MDLLNHGVKKYTLNDLDSIKNREDRSTLIIRSLFPERFLSEEIAHPDEVKLLALDVSFDNNESACKCTRQYMDNTCTDCFVWDNKYTNTLCSGLTKFHNLETLCVVDLDLSIDAGSIKRVFNAFQQALKTKRITYSCVSHNP